jgi:hypothetical protein
MNNIYRDKFLTIQLGECWHEFGFQICPICKICKGTHINLTKPFYNNFSTPDGFFKLWNWSQEQEWWGALKWRMSDIDAQHHIAERYIHPDRFADAVYNYLKEKL